ncbi:hypothetical protein M378DRAFT_162714 [Amanita muscaria Koide BX008]|uniref:Nephrocystin 3-like N-terminal domain-containing protein n=1 Tax=Amanita muscaria (strain Koide BX008) TaxID=946122 RepID=A0A0C2TDF8_AMAMK|nr:hypothetical protein M378DRAFT_162714 [Amanita muscaria Koide BX008]
MTFFSNSSNVNISNSTFNEIHGNVVSIHGRISETEKDLNMATLADAGVIPKKRPLDQSIGNLPRTQAAYNDYQAKKQSGACFDGTREALLQDMEDWIPKQGNTRIYVLSGLAGIGKSTVAYTIAARADKDGLLGASFFFSRDEEDRKNAKKFFTTLAFQLCLYNQMFADAIAAALHTDRGAAATTKGPQEQLQALILEPLRSIVATSIQTTVIIVDALDECDDQDVPSVLIGLSQLVGDLTSFKVILTTRPKPLLEYHYGSQANKTIFHLQDIEAKVVDGDIRLYLKYNLSQEQVRAHLHDSKEEWHASDDEIETLVLAAGRLFIIASTSVRFILNPKLADPGSRMKRLLDAFAQGRTPFSDLNSFYLVILQDAVECDDDEIVGCYQAVVGAIVLIQNPLPVTTLAQLIDRREKQIRAVLRNLQSIILLGSDDVPLIYHTSFTDYITDPARCKDSVLRIDPNSHHTRLVIHCFRIMNRHLKQNIMNLGDPARFMKNQDGLVHEKISDELLLEKISSELRYACVYWANHLDNAAIENADLMQALKTFAHEHLLHWLETLSWIEKLGSAHRALGVVLKRLKSPSSDLRQLLSDGQRFVIRFYGTIEHSALHTYYSALPFTPTESHLYGRYHKETLHNFCQVLGGAERWDALLAAPNHGEDVHHVGFSLDNTIFASCGAGMLKFWDAATGTPASQIPVDSFAVSSDFSTVASFDHNTLTLYNVRNSSTSVATFSTSTTILDVALSPDGSCVAVGSEDGTLCLWDSKKCAVITSLDDFYFSEDEDEDVGDEDEDVGDEDEDEDGDDEDEDVGNDEDEEASDLADEEDDPGSELDLLAFSSTGTRLAYRSMAGGIKLCNGINGDFVANLDCQLEAPDGFLYSRDGSRIAVLSEKGTLTLWDSEKGQLMGTSAGAGEILAISANGSLLASALDNQVSLWRENGGNLLPLAPGVPHLPNEITALAFSEDDILAIGTQHDKVMLYDVEKQSFTSSFLIVEPTTLAFSPDCTRLVAGSGGGALYLWDISNIKASGNIPSEDDESRTSVTEVAFSQDIRWLACGFRDGKVELWDKWWETRPTKQLFVANHHHEGPVSKLTFSSSGMLFASRSANGAITLWNGEDGASVGPFDYEPHVELEAVSASNDILDAATDDDYMSDIDVGAVALSSDILAAATDDGVALWNTKTKELVDTLKEHDSMLLSFSAHGDLLASCASRRAIVTIFNIAERTATVSFKVDKEWDIHTMAFLPDNSQLVMKFFDGDFQSFNLANKKVVKGTTPDHLSQLPHVPFWHGIPVGLCTDGVQHSVTGLFHQHGSCASVLWIPTDIGLLCGTQGSSMIALGCNDGRVILVKSSAGMGGTQ